MQIRTASLGSAASSASSRQPQDRRGDSKECTSAFERHSLIRLGSPPPPPPPPISVGLDYVVKRSSGDGVVGMGSRGCT